MIGTYFVVVSWVNVTMSIGGKLAVAVYGVVGVGLGSVGIVINTPSDDFAVVSSFGIIFGSVTTTPPSD